ncbi:ATP-dependent RNA helicase RhlE [hydrothermal vent metagenome]|uniref:ATP-dependent RNA helicase RhlE n=1 Tax=hydrothermal vent metagenome TaxID=652676 RepID=A0A3B0SJA2_9ZZZZ
MTQFSELALAEPILRAVADEGYTAPTPIQAKVIPQMLDGRDIIGIAQTGTGKTAAFVLPLLHQHLQLHGRPGHKSCHALILAPTRELAAQIAQNIENYGKHIQHSVTVVVGGVRPGPQIKALSQGVDIVVATPGRLEDHISTGKFRLDKTTTVILDEADQMLDLGFMPAIRRILSKLPKQRQTLLLSATMPKQIRALAGDFLNQPVEISVAPQSRPIERIQQTVYFAEKPAKRDLLTTLLSAPDVRRAIVFTRTKHGANKVVQNLEKAGIAAAAIHGNKSQNQRQKTLAAFKSAQLNVLVATDIAARGIDIDDISHVINYEIPNIAETYVHRIGRTARAGKGGVAISLCDGSERKFLRGIEKLIGTNIPKENTPQNTGPIIDAPIAKNTAPVHQPPARKKRRPRPKAKPATANHTNKPTKSRPNRKRR